MTDDSFKFSARAEAALAAAREVAPADAALRARVDERVHASLAAASAGLAAAKGASTIASSSSTLWAKLVLVGALTGGLIAGVVFLRHPTEPSTATPELPSAHTGTDRHGGVGTVPVPPPVIVETPPTAPALPETPPPVTPADVLVAPASVRAPAALREDTLAAENALIEQARAALANGNAEQGLGLLREHSRTFSRGSLAEEREALTVQGLVLAGRAPDALRAAARFDTRHPNSLFAPVVNAARARAEAAHPNP